MHCYMTVQSDVTLKLHYMYSTCHTGHVEVLTGNAEHHKVFSISTPKVDVMIIINNIQNSNLKIAQMRNISYVL